MTNGDPTRPQHPYGPPPPFPPAGANRWATWSIVMAFVFAPAGAAFGHWALADSRYGRGRNRAVLGLVLSYTIIVVAVGALVVWAVVPRHPTTTTAADTTTDTPAPTSTAHPTMAPPAPKPPTLGAADLPKVLLGLDEVRAITNIPSLTVLGPPGGGEPPNPPPDPPECDSAVYNGVSSVFGKARATGFTALHYGDFSATTAALVEQTAGTFADADAAQRFFRDVADQWRRCSGKRVTFTAPSLASLTWTIGNVVVTADRVTLQNPIMGKRSAVQFRVIAAKANVVVELNTQTLQMPADQPQAIVTQVLARIPG